MNNVKSLVAGMSLKEKVGQLFQIGFSGKKLSEDIQEMIEDYYIGGIIFFSRNIESPQQLAALSNGLQETALNTRLAKPLFISTDQEGGTVTRLKGTTHFPGQMAIGATQSKELAAEAGKAIARELRSVGVNMDLAPVLDVNNNPDNPVIGVRSFGEDQELVAGLGTAYIQAMQKEGVVACGKHFPGHGDTDTDSHLSLPIIRHDRKRLNEIELYPFKVAIQHQLDSIMTAHVYFPAIEKKTGLPATLSYDILTGLLREEMGFEGLIITDCLEMNAIVSTFGTIEGAVMTVEAGSDLVLISHTIEKAKKSIEAVITAVEQGRIAESRIDKSVERILELKEKRITNPLVDVLACDNSQGEELAYRIARRAVTMLKDEQQLLPVKGDDKLLVCDFNMGRVSLAEDNQTQKNILVDILQEKGLTVDYHTFKKGQLLIPDLTKYDLVIVCSYNAVDDPEQVEIIQKLQQRLDKLLVLSVRNPYDIKVLPGLKAFMTIYDYSPFNYQAAAEVITGKIKAEGILPVTI